MRIPPVVTVVLVCLTVLTVRPVLAQEAAPSPDDIVPPFMLMNADPGQPAWAPLLKVRDAEDTYRDTDWWYTYADIASQVEAAMGNHRAALAMRDTAGPRPDSVAVLPDGTTARNAVDVIASVADTAQVIMINERHHAASDRLLTLRLLPVLYDKGYRYLAAEAFSHLDTSLNSRAYPVQKLTGTYTDEVVFAELVREALRLGFTLIPYEYNHSDYSAESGFTRQQFRDWQQATHLHERILQKDPDARILVHAGFAHIKEHVTETWYPMAVYFREITGINPVTIDQTVMSERSEAVFEHPVYRAAIEHGMLDEAPVVLFDAAGRTLPAIGYEVDMQVLTPRTTYSDGRPDWMRMGGLRAPVDVSIPECRYRMCFIEVRAASEAENAVPLDRTQVDARATVRVFLPTGSAAHVDVYDAEGVLLRRSTTP